MPGIVEYGVQSILGNTKIAWIMQGHQVFEIGQDYHDPEKPHECAEP
ncbi:hypothetical protein LOT_1822 [Lentilactobacillus otakiensis DSM 19908 = JCM 15040]|uniref:Uncharacterized protein n=1 Tax=Lentilactobacillus otakiensis DSM 19908 = JCM 15040 TaxID=1423780 RepID=S4NEC4_9LACO|nr:hypothetical protein LOT_1822 [Lentilactobacillus otakiensis DSM 19908 = JCM 15040]